VPHYGSEFAVSMALSCLMYAALSSSWSLFCGSTRYLSLATSAFFGIGAYVSALTLESARLVRQPSAWARHRRRPWRW
jgi:branched-chain amino acid transport system permease protein